MHSRSSSDPSSSACGLSRSTTRRTRSRGRHARRVRQVHERALEPVARGEELVLVEHLVRVAGQLVALLELLAQLLHHRLDERRERERVLDARLRVHHADLDRAEVRVRPDVVPEVGVVLDRARLDHELDPALVVRPSPRSAAGSRHAGMRGRSACAWRAGASRRRARRASWPRARAGAARARACRWRRRRPCPGRPRPRARARRRSAPGARRTGARRSGRGSAGARRSAGPPTCANGCVPAEPIARPEALGGRLHALAQLAQLDVRPRACCGTARSRSRKRDSISSGLTAFVSPSASRSDSIEFESSSVSASTIISSSSMPMVYAGPVNRCSTARIVDCAGRVKKGVGKVALGYDGKLYILAFDHRGSFQKKWFGLEGDPSPGGHRADRRREARDLRGAREGAREGRRAERHRSARGRAVRRAERDPAGRQGARAEALDAGREVGAERVRLPVRRGRLRRAHREVRSRTSRRSSSATTPTATPR